MWTINYIIKGFGPNDIVYFQVPEFIFTFPIIKEVTLRKDCCDEEEAHYFNIKKPWLPKGTILKVKYQFTNYYGVFLRCEHENGTYDINRCDCDYKLIFTDFIGQLPDNYGKGLWSKSDWDPRKEGFQEFEPWANKHNIFKNPKTGEYEYKKSSILNSD